MDLGIQNRVAIITGASSGIGLATAQLLGQEACRLVLSDLKGTDWSAIDAVVPKDSIKVEGDLTVQADCQKVVEAAVAQAGGLDIVIHTAGITGDKGDPIEMTDEAWREAWEIDFFSAVRMCRAAIPYLRKRKWGRMVFITSENVVQPYWEEAVYNCAKASLTCFVKNISKEEAKHGIMINSVAPAFIETPMTDGMMEKRAAKMGVSESEAVKSFLDEERPGIAVKRRGTPEEVASVIALLVSQRASFINGSNYRVDGGSVLTANY